jgi:hypothetical protein
MKLYEITNGYCGNSYVRCLVVAENKEKAVELATPKFKAESNNEYNSYPDKYWNNLDAEEICDCENEFVGEIDDG